MKKEEEEEEEEKKLILLLFLWQIKLTILRSEIPMCKNLKFFCFANYTYIQMLYS